MFICFVLPIVYTDTDSFAELSIHVECAFGMLVQCWEILQIALTSNFMVSKFIALVMALAKLHNFSMMQSCAKDGIYDTLV